MPFEPAGWAKAARKSVPGNISVRMFWKSVAPPAAKPTGVLPKNSAATQVATPADWKKGEDCIIVPALQDEKVLKEKFPKGYKVVKPYLRITPDPSK